MKKFNVTITETLEMVVEIEAETLLDAIEIAEDRRNDEVYVLDASHFTGVDFDGEEVKKERDFDDDFDR